jgi:small subunit ribosomal protein S9
MNKIITSGKRKTSIARAVIIEGIGEISINRKDYKNLSIFDRLSIEEPLRITKNILGELKFNISITVKGGGEKSRIEASRLALARAIVQFTKSEALENAFLDYDRNLIVADVRRKEPNKPGDSKARAKRQTSYR